MPAAAMYIAHGAIGIQLVEPIITWINSCMAETVLVDTAAVTFIDSDGLRAFLDAKADLGAQARVFRIVNRSPAFDRLLAIAGLINAAAPRCSKRGEVPLTGRQEALIDRARSSG